VSSRHHDTSVWLLWDHHPWWIQLPGEHIPLPTTPMHRFALPPTEKVGNSASVASFG